ncbi:hypothetical protein BOS5A_140008 [Bosea sp. EC-HK365B]|nr:hypothetical protein BOSE7B_150060 [Bosea sp. 7B]CAD5271493.1 hypothetical protein BOSE21B_20008 [Bosea sp. 21B]CAD5273634.1 hypothetical protein BOSE46_20306 [Bosea sp. 46]VVT56173.1 hypothetical protein BOS5A_140008 [Bosea sp. EC-HK365B]VXC06274.1 hypothetical protein BOSE29B_20007 [Bosea sp. 29B]
MGFYTETGIRIRFTAAVQLNPRSAPMGHAARLSGGRRLRGRKLAGRGEPDIRACAHLGLRSSALLSKGHVPDRRADSGTIR